MDDFEFPEGPRVGKYCILFWCTKLEQGDVRGWISCLCSVFIRLGCFTFTPRLLARPVQHLFSGEEMAQALWKASPHLFLFFQLRTVPSAFRRKTRLNYTDFHGPFWPFQTHDSWPCLPNSRNWLQRLTPVLLFPVYISRLLPCSYLLNHLCQASWAECGVPWALPKHLSQTAILVARCACSLALPPNSH